MSSVLFNPYNNNSFLKLSMTFSSGGIPCVCVVPGYDGDRELIQCHQQLDKQEKGQEQGGEEPCRACGNFQAVQMIVDGNFI